MIIKFFYLFFCIGEPQQHHNCKVALSHNLTQYMSLSNKETLRQLSHIGV